MLRRGVHLLLDELRRLTAAGQLMEGMDWAMTGVRERCLRIEKRLPTQWREPVDLLDLQSRMLASREIFHGAAGWVNPKRLVDAWLRQEDGRSSIELKTLSCVENISDLDADVIVVACGYQTPSLLPYLRLVLQPIRGQVEWGRIHAQSLTPLKGPPFNGMGHWITSPHRWLAGATFQRDEVDLQPRAKDIDKNFEKLAALMPELDRAELTKLRKEAHSWVGVRVAQKNRQPLMVQPDSIKHPNLWVCTGLGSRGLSLAMLCANNLFHVIEGRVA
jgi:tRNA 5-methylaminomethyl-2-thiouridine biosynthesis bifunctional protein